MKTGIIIQARSDSRRFPKKIFNKIGNKNILEHVISRIKKVKFKKIIIVATTKKKSDEKVIKCAKKNRCYYFRGSENNVLQRYFLTAKKFKIKNIIRVSADSPFIDPKIIEKAYRIFSSSKYDYVSNIIKPTYPKGMSCEIFNFNCLKIANYAKTSSFEKEHVTPYIIKNTRYFKIKNFSINKKYRNYRFAIDRKQDLLFLRKLFNRISKSRLNSFNYKQLISLKVK